VNTNPQVIDTIAKVHYLASHAQVEQLASLIFLGKKGGNTYTAVVLAYCKDALPKRAKPSKRAALKAIDKVHDDLYPHVLKGITNGQADINDNERNRRAIFARTAASTLRGFVRAGGDLRKLEPETVTKTSLRTQGKRVPAGTRAERAMTKYVDAVVRSAQKIAAKDPGEAHDRIEKAMTALEELLEDVTKLEAAARKGKAARKAKGKTKARTTRTSKEQPGLYQ
jgi:hypothetical protein